GAPRETRVCQAVEGCVTQGVRAQGRLFSSHFPPLFLTNKNAALRSEKKEPPHHNEGRHPHASSCPEQAVTWITTVFHRGLSDSAESCFAASGAARTTGPSMKAGAESHLAFFG